MKQELISKFPLIKETPFPGSAREFVYLQEIIWVVQGSISPFDITAIG
jgi:hypothetical protein